MDVCCSPPALSYPDGGQQTPAALQAIKQLVRLLLAREDASLLEPLAPLPRACPALLASLGELPAVDLLATIRRQRLECLLHADPYAAELLPALWPSLQRLARREMMAALALASLTREISSLLQQAQIPLLVIKGVPLALQTTRSIASRGRGDLDLFVNPSDVVRTVAVLQAAGFQTIRSCDLGFIDASLLGRYRRWLYYELSLCRQKGEAVQTLDLHWRLDLSYKALPTFRRCYAQRTSVLIGDTSIGTLNLPYAFQHACAHAAKDNWMCLRNLVDIHRLARMLDHDLLIGLQCYSYVKSSCLVTHELTGLALQLPPVRQPPAPAESIIQKVEAYQLLGWRQAPPQPPYRSFVPGWLVQFKSLMDLNDCNNNWAGRIGFLAELMRVAVPPEALVNPKTGRHTLPLGFYIKRFKRYFHRITCVRLTAL
jgi:hypothetical protein